jgi:hypothetical protein
MNAPVKIDTDHIAHGTPAAFREFIGECFAMARIEAGLGETYCSIGDDVGLEYAARKLTAYARAMLATLADLKEMKKREAGDAG